MKTVLILSKSSKTLYKGELVETKLGKIVLRNIQRAHFRFEADRGVFSRKTYEKIWEGDVNAKNSGKTNRSRGKRI
jgi:hypothetical protein